MFSSSYGSGKNFKALNIFHRKEELCHNLFAHKLEEKHEKPNLFLTAVKDVEHGLPIPVILCSSTLETFIIKTEPELNFTIALLFEVRYAMLNKFF